MGIIFYFIFNASPIYANGQLHFYELRTEKKIQNILEDLEFAITERNLRITGRYHIGKAIRERDNQPFPDYEIILYCNLTFAKNMLELKPEYINLCPGRITVRQQGKSYIISGPLWPEAGDNVQVNEHMHHLNTQIREIIDYASEYWQEINQE